MVKELCSADIYGSKFTVPCDPLHHLDTMYGPDFKWLQRSNTPVNDISKSILTINWENSAEWHPSLVPYIYRKYDFNGQILESESLHETNKFFRDESLKMTRLPMIK
jgi:hypothetical protein